MPDYYQSFGLDETATSRQIAQAYLSPYGNKDEEDEAYHVIGDPIRRARYDMHDLGLTQEELAARITKKSATGVAWTLIFAFVAASVALRGGENISRVVGGTFAPGYAPHERWVEKESCQELYDGRTTECTSGHYEVTFSSTDKTWDRALNNGLVVTILPTLLFGGLAWAGYRPVIRLVGHLIAQARYSGHSDTFVRRAVWIPIVAIPGVFFVLLVIMPSSFG